MQHLDTDRLAALADEPPTDAEASHLAACVVCRRERDAFVALLALAKREGSAALTADAPASGPPLTSWESLSGALRAEGLARPDGAATGPAREATVRPLTAARSATFLRRAAASIALILGGGAVGRLTAPQAVAAHGASQPPAPTQVAAAPTPLAPTNSAAPAPRGDSVVATRASRALSDTLPVWGETDAPLASGRGFSGVPDAMQTLARAQRDYQRAAVFLAEHDTGTVSGTPQILRARLAALDEVMPKVREALYEAPQDPVLNQYYLTTADVRESTLRQLGRVLPTGARLNAF